MRVFRAVVVLAVSMGLTLVPSSVEATTDQMSIGQTSKWELSKEQLPVAKDRVIGLKLDDHRVMWLGGEGADAPTDARRTFIYDIRTRGFKETAPIPAAKGIDLFAIADVLRDGTVVVAGGSVEDPSRSVLSYRYDPKSDRWARTGDLPEAQQWFFTPSTRLSDGRVMAAGGIGLDGVATGVGSLKAFVYDVRQTSTVNVIDPNTGVPTGQAKVVQGKWDYTRKPNGAVSTLSSGHIFGNAVLLRDGRVFIGGGHVSWNLDTDASVQSSVPHYFDPATGIWSEGAAFPVVSGEDDRIANSHGGRANGVGIAVLDNGKVVIAGGTSHTDGEAYFGPTQIGRRSILVMTPSANPLNSHYEISPRLIPTGVGSGALFGDGGRNHLLAYSISHNRVVLAGGQSTLGEDLFDTYVFDPQQSTLKRGPDMAHGVADWAEEFGYPADYQAGAISTRAVSARNSKLVFDDVLVHGGAYDGIGSSTFPGSRFVEQLKLGS